MRFRFCGDADCPDWVLTEITTLTRMTSIKFKLLSQVVAKALAGEATDLEKAKKLTADAKLDWSDSQAAIAALRWLLCSAAKHGVDPDSFSSELQQIGLPREHSQAVARVLSDNINSITSHLRSQSLRVSRLQNVSCSVDASLASRVSGCPSILNDLPVVQLSLEVDDCIANSSRTHDIKMSPLQLRTLISDLKKARLVMESL